MFGRDCHSFLSGDASEPKTITHTMSISRLTFGDMPHLVYLSVDIFENQETIKQAHRAARAPGHPPVDEYITLGSKKALKGSPAGFYTSWYRT